jgi:N-acetyl-gamma-glutamyl-phosphate reductase
MTARLFIDGEAGTTGLQIRSRLEGRPEFELMSLPEDRRKDAGARAEMLNAADLVILCLPDDAARAAVAMIENRSVRVIDASTAHRTSEGWVYGFPEYDGGQGGRIAAAKRVTNPGCYALTSVAILHPLVSAGIVPADWPVTINAVSGYTGGGKSLIGRFEDPDADESIDSAFLVYGLDLAHKHVPEIQRFSGLEHPPLFVPSVGRFRQGMIVQVPLQLWSLPARPSPGDIHAVLARHYAHRACVTVADRGGAEGPEWLYPEDLNGTNELRLHVFGNEGERQAVVAGVVDNLGKGASGQAVQNLNLMLGLDEMAGLERAPEFAPGGA